MVGQIKTRGVTTNTVMRRISFRQGMNDYLNGCDWREYLGSDKKQWSYERGRLFAACFPWINPESVKSYKGRVHSKWQNLYREARDEGSII